MYALNDHVVVLSAGSTTWVAILLAFIVMNPSVLPFSPWLPKSLLVLRAVPVAGVNLAARDGLAATKPANATSSNGSFHNSSFPCLAHLLATFSSRVSDYFMYGSFCFIAERVAVPPCAFDVSRFVPSSFYRLTPRRT